MPTKSKTESSRKTAKPAGADSTSLEGRKAPDFQLVDDRGRTVRLADLTGSKDLVLYFYPKDMTPGCTTEACAFRDSLEAIRRAGAQIVGVSGDSQASHEKFRDKYDLNFPLLSDPDNRAAKAYGVYKKKSLYGREFMGIERTTFIIGKDGVVRKVFPKVKVAGHAEQVLAALKEMD